jgi:myo-inositol-1-phosphate synthase
MGSKKGIMFVGLCGHLSTTAMAGCLALEKKLCPPIGLVTQKKALDGISFFDFSDIVFGGWDIRPFHDPKKVLKDTGIDDFQALADIEKKLKKIQERAFPGIAINAGCAIDDLSVKKCVFVSESLSDSIDKVKNDIQRFRSENSLDQVVVVNLASTEPPVQDPEALGSIRAIENLIKENRVESVRPSLIYAYAAIVSKCVYINFTPSEGGLSQGLVDLANQYQVPLMGCDGKTGETLVKSALAPLFAMRNLEVMSWEGYNLLGNMDGQVLQNKENGSTKIKSKDRLLPHILGYPPHSKVTIDYVPSLGDRKTAWDFIHFKGFLNTVMSLQFTWQGCDSALAAPLVLDLARFGILALQRGEYGLMTHLASFFKSPWGVDEHALGKQFQFLEEYCSKVKEE